MEVIWANFWGNFSGQFFKLKMVPGGSVLLSCFELFELLCYPGFAHLPGRISEKPIHHYWTIIIRAISSFSGDYSPAPLNL